MSDKISGTFTEDGSSTAAIIEGDSVFINGIGDFGGGLLTAEILLDDGVTWSGLEGKVYNGRFSETIDLPREIKFRLTLDGATSPDLDYEIYSKSNKGC